MTTPPPTDETWGAALDPIVQESTPKVIAERLREAIASGAFPPGSQMREITLAQRLGVSRGPLREAMQRLTQEGLLIGHRNRGLFVMTLDEDAVRDVFLTRQALERAAVEHLITTGRGEDAEPLLELAEQMGRAEDPSGPEVTALDLRFHATLVALAGSPRLQQMHGTLITQLRMTLARMQATYSSARERSEEHRDLARAIIAGDAALADRLMIEHMADGERRVLLGLGQAARA